jgi:hypothetical protein
MVDSAVGALGTRSTDRPECTPVCASRAQAGAYSRSPLAPAVPEAPSTIGTAVSIGLSTLTAERPPPQSTAPPHP